MATTKRKCIICGGTGKNAAFIGGKTVTSPCGGCNGTGYQVVNTNSASPKGCMLFILGFLVLGIGFTIVKYFS